MPQSNTGRYDSFGQPLHEKLPVDPDTRLEELLDEKELEDYLDSLPKSPDFSGEPAGGVFDPGA